MIKDEEFITLRLFALFEKRSKTTEKAASKNLLLSLYYDSEQIRVYKE